MNHRRLFIFLLWALLPCLTYGQQWELKKAPLMTKYAQQVDPSKVLPEYPRPQMAREKWLNLNGLWEFKPGIGTAEAIPSGKLPRTILVPFPVESAISGVMEHYERLWYRRTFAIPKEWKGQKLLLHFGAVDYLSEVFVNGKQIGSHAGGYDPFSFDITSAIKGEGEQELLVKVYDPTDAGGYPRGKQTLNPRGIMYTSVTGIWQTVWLEPVPKTSIQSLKIVPDIDKSVVKVTVNTDGDASALSVEIKINDENKLIQTKTGKANIELEIPVSNAKLWAPDSPFLYDLNVALVKGKNPVDAIKSYFGMRKISVQDEGGFKKLYLNNKFLFHMGPLDQGFWPDGIYTAPTDEALKYDIEMIKKFGFNMVRKHIKVEPYRWYYWADKLGVMVWQDMPSANSYTEKTPPVDTAAYSSELTRMIKTHWNSPSIVMWVVFNESQGQHNTAGLVNKVRQLDPTRVINQASGGEHFGVGDVLDIHSYPPPSCPFSTTQALACGEYGGIGYKIKGHLWNEGFGYIMATNDEEYNSWYDEYASSLAAYKTNSGLSAAVYTEITDVEIEINGLMTYDRAVVKGDLEKIKASNTKVIKEDIYLNEALPTSQLKPRDWKYTLDKPDTTQWFTQNFDDSKWKTGPAGFGTKGTPGGEIRTTWDTHNIWLRQEFTLGDLSKVNKNNFVLFIHHDDNCVVYLNGVKAADLKGYTSGYAMSSISKEAKNALISNGKNVIAIYCKQDQGGQFIDAGLSIKSTEKPTSKK